MPVVVRNVNGTPEDLGVLGLEHAVGRRVVARPAERPADNLLAQQLGPECADAQDVSHGVGVPALGEHRDRHDAPDVRAQPVRLADGVQDLAQDVLVGQVVRAAAGEAGDVFALELVDLPSGGLLERGVQGVAAVELHGVDEQADRPMAPGAGIDIAEQRELAGNRDRRPIGHRPVVARDPVEHELGHARVRAHHDEHGRTAHAGLCPLAKRPLVVPVQALQRPFELLGQDRISLPHRRVAQALAREPIAHVDPQIAVPGELADHRVVGHRHARHLDDPGFDRVHEPEVRYDPREQGALGVPRSLEEEWRRRHVEDAPDADLVTDGAQALEPDAGLLLVLPRLGALVGVEPAFEGLVGWGRCVAVVRLVVEDHEILRGAEHPADAADHLARRFLEPVEVAARAGEDLLGQCRCLLLLPSDEGVVVGDLDRRRLESVQLLRRHEVHRPVEGLGIVGQEHAEAVADGDPRRDDEEAGAEPLVVRVGELVERLPGDQHPHHDGLARTRGHLECEPGQRVVESGVLGPDDVERLRIAQLVSGLGQVDRSLGRLQLTEEQATVAVLGPPVGEQLLGDRRRVGVALEPPASDCLADLVDDLVGFLARPAAELQGKLRRTRFLGLRHRHEELAGPAPRLDVAQHLTVDDLEMTLRLEERRVDDGVVDRSRAHGHFGWCAHAPGLTGGLDRQRALPLSRPSGRLSYSTPRGSLGAAWMWHQRFAGLQG